MNRNEDTNYNDWSDEELAEALDSVDKNIENYHKTIGLYRKNLNRSMEDRDDIISVLLKRNQHKGWNRRS